MRLTRYWQCSLLLLLTSLSIKCSAQVSTIGVQDLIRYVDHNYRSIRAAEVVYSVETVPGKGAEDLKRRGTAISPVENAMASALSSRQKAVVRLLFREDMYRYEYNGHIANINDTTTVGWVLGYDGRRFWRYNPAAKEGSLLGEDIRCEDPRVPYVIYEHMYALSKRVSEAPPHTRARAVTLEGKQIPVYLLSLRGQGYVEHLYFAPSKGYILYRSDILTDSGGKVTREIVDVKEVKDGAWFPMKTRTTMYDDKGRVILTTMIQVHSVKTGNDITPDMFKPSFPLGTRVSDLINNRVYIVTSPIWTFRRTLLALAILALLFGFWWWRYRLPGKRTAV